MNILTDDDIANGYVRSIYALNTAKHGSKTYYELLKQVRRWQTLEDTARKDRYGFPTGVNYRSDDFMIDKCPKPNWG